MSWDFSTEPEYQAKLDWAREFVREEVYPLEVLDLDHAGFRRLAAPLQDRVKEQGLWAAHLGPELGGQGYGQLRLALLHEILGTSDLAPYVFGCQAPDSGNAELLAVAGTEHQRATWMYPLLDGKLLSAFAMTEQGTGSDPRQFTTSAHLEPGQTGQEWVLNGIKWFVGNASRADFHIVVAVTEPDAPPHQRMSLLIVPRSSPGIGTRELGLMNDPDHRHPVWSHCEVTYHDVRVPAENLLGGRGQAFALAQKRLGPGRIHHAMRWVGVCRRAFDMLCERAVSVDVHGSLLADKQTIQNWVADAAAAIESTRLLTLHTAWKIDQVGAEAARTEIAMISYHGAAVMHDVIDKAIQVHGALGFSTDMPLEQMYRWARAARIYDGPDEVHRVTVARRLLRGYTPATVPTEHIPTRRAAALGRLAGDPDAAAIPRATP
jgi:acyl-CoA dehydrogenase